MAEDAVVEAALGMEHTVKMWLLAGTGREGDVVLILRDFAAGLFGIDAKVDEEAADRAAATVAYFLMMMGLWRVSRGGSGREKGALLVVEGSGGRGAAGEAAEEAALLLPLPFVFSLLVVFLLRGLVAPADPGAGAVGARRRARGR